MEELYIGSPGITDEGMRHVAKLTNLKKLMLFGCDNITNEGLAQLTTLKSLKHLDITDSKITIGGLSHLNKIPTLYKMVLDEIEQDHAGLNICGLKNLEELTLGLKTERVDWENKSVITQKFSAADLVCLANLKRLRSLQGINNVTDTSLKKLAGLTNMETFSFAATGLTDDGLKTLANMKNLALLHINNKYPAKASGAGGRILTDEGLRYLQGLKMLTYVQIDSDNNFSTAAIRRLRRGLPNLYFMNINGSNGQPTEMGARASALKQPRRPTLVRQRPARSRTTRQNSIRPIRRY
jgi:F-box/leucine-rich repeat protein 14